MKKVIVDNECLTKEEYYLNFLENKRLWCEYLKQNVIDKSEKNIEIYFTNERFSFQVEKAIEEFIDCEIKIIFINSYKKDSDIVEKREWKTVDCGYIGDVIVPTHIDKIPMPYMEYLEYIQNKEHAECILANIIVNQFEE